MTKPKEKACCGCRSSDADPAFADTAEVHGHIMAAINAKSKTPLTASEALGVTSLSLSFARIVTGSRTKETWESIAHLALSVAATYKDAEACKS